LKEEREIKRVRRRMRKRKRSGCTQDKKDGNWMNSIFTILKFLTNGT
jgi:hypothetical protein